MSWYKAYWKWRKSIRLYIAHDPRWKTGYDVVVWLENFVAFEKKPFVVWTAWESVVAYQGKQKPLAETRAHSSMVV